MSSTDIRAALGAALKIHPTARIHVSPSLEALPESISNLRRLDRVQPALESQQLDSNTEAKVKAEVERRLAGPDPAHTIPTIYAISGSGLAEGKVEDQNLLREAIREKLDDNSDVVVALIPTISPADIEGAPVEPVSAELSETATQVLANLEIPVLESWDAVDTYLARMGCAPDTMKIELSVESVKQYSREDIHSVTAHASFEGFIDHVFNGFSWLYERFRKKTEFDDWIERYGKPTTAFQGRTFREGAVSSKGIIFDLYDRNRKAPADPAGAIRKHFDHALSQYQALVQAIRGNPKTVAKARFDAGQLLGGVTVEYAETDREVDHWRQGRKYKAYRHEGHHAERELSDQNPNDASRLPTEIPALTQQQAQALAGVIAECTKRYWKFQATIYVKGGDHDDYTFPIGESPNREVWYELFHNWDNMDPLLFAPLEAAHLWIQRSLK